MIKSDLRFRSETTRFDEAHVREIVASSGFFNKDEILVAVELVSERLQKGVESGYHFVFSEMNNRTVAYACFGPIPGTQSSFDLYWIAVHEKYRSMGIGKKLLVHAESTMREMGGSRIYIETSSREQYEPTRAFYLNNGYSLEALIRDFYAPGDSKCIYLKVI
jgi:ribosomal protein S18 acetylase RimI-like enzyme